MLSPTHVRMHVWERGAGRTLACGTGACATVVAGVLEGKTQRTCQVRAWRRRSLGARRAGPPLRSPPHLRLLARRSCSCAPRHPALPHFTTPTTATPLLPASLQVDLPGGPLHIEWREADNHIYMTGPAELVFSGSVSV